VKDINDYLKEGQVVKVKVIQTDEKGRVRLSAKALLNEAAATQEVEPTQPQQ
jgi:polyribonucleotide nucleotidyltransferase